MKKNKYEIILLIIVIIFLLFQALKWLGENNFKKNYNEIRLGNCFWKVEEARDQESQRRGLSGRESLCEECGMFFVFSKPDKYGFWMKDMLFPLDMVWIRNGEVVDQTSNISNESRETYYPIELVDSVLEINSGDIDRCDIKKGDKIK